MKELRFTNHPIEIRKTEDSRKVRGYALVWDSESVDLGGFNETISRNALEGVIEKSDVLALLNHNQDRGVLARSSFGHGSLHLEVDDTGLRYEFDAPNTALGDELLEGLRRGDISQSSFGFTVAEERWEKRDNKLPLRHIARLDMLYDISPVYFPAYQSTSVVCDTRGLESLFEEIETEDNMVEEDKMEQFAQLAELRMKVAELEQKMNIRSEESKEDEQREEPEKKEEDPEKKSEEKEPEEKEEKNEEEKEDEKRSAPLNQTESKFTNINIIARNSTMNENKFSFIRAINDVINNRSAEGFNAEVLAQGRTEARNSGVNATGQILIPTEAMETRADGVYSQQGNTTGGYDIAETKTSILEPLYSKLIFNQIGASMLTGLTSNISIPSYSGSKSNWAGEIEKAANGVGEWGELKMSPKRLTTTIKVSTLFLEQQTNGAEEMLKRDILTSIQQKLEQTVFGDEAGTANRPEGLFYNVTADSTPITYEDIILMEEDLEHANVYGSKYYVMSPSAKAILRATRKDAGSGLFVYADNDTINGINAVSVSNVKSKGLILGDFSDLVVGQWGPVSLTVDNITLADEAQVKLTINSFWDVLVRRPEGFVKKVLA